MQDIGLVGLATSSSADMLHSAAGIEETGEQLLVGLVFVLL